MITIIFISTHWNYSNGGINSFNFDLALHLGNEAKKENYRVICLSYIDPSNQQVNEAKKNNLEILSLNKTDVEFEFDKDLKIINELLSKYKRSDFIYFVGHDIFTGDLANYLKHQYKKSASVVFHHMDYESYYAIKGDISPSQLVTKFSKQTQILQEADLVIGVGPKLFSSALSKTTKPVFKIIPGIQNIQKWPHKSNKLSIITFGRYDERTDRLKQMGLVVQAFSEYMNIQAKETAGDFTLKIIGINSREEAASLLTQNISKSNRYLNILPLPYTESRINLFDLLRKSNISLMLSYHEGFGLAGFEAIAASVPLILSKNSGLYEFLIDFTNSNELKDYGIYPIQINSSVDGSINEIDIKTVVKAITEVYDNIDVYQQNILKLKIKLSEDFTWRNTAKSILSILKSFQKIEQIKPDTTGKVKDSRSTDYQIKQFINRKSVSLPSISLNYVPRKDLEKNIIDTCNKENSTFIIGDHGVGKTSLVIDFIEKHYNYYNHILWIDFQNSIKQSIVSTVLKNIDIKSEQFQNNLDLLFEKVISFMNEISGEKLLIIDNIDDMDELRSFVTDFKVHDWRIIVTSTKNINIIPESKKVVVGVMNYTEGFKLYKNICGNNSSTLKFKDFQRILSIEELSPFLIEYFSYSMKQELIFHKYSSSQLSTETKVSTLYRFFKPTGTLSNFFSEIFNQEALLFSEREKSFLYTYSLFPNNFSDTDVIKEILLLEFSELESIEFLNTFIESGWVSRNKKIHFLRQQIVLKYIEPIERILNKIIDYISAKLDVISGDNPMLKLKYLPIAYSLVNKISNTSSINSMLHKIGILEFDFGNLDKAIELQKKALDSSTDSTNNGDILFDIGLIEERKGHYKKSIENLIDALAYRDPKSMKKVNTLSKISVVYGKLFSRENHLNYYELAIKYYEESIDLIENLIENEIIAEENPDVGTIYIDSAAVLSKFKEYQKIANQLFIKGIRIYESKLSRLHPWLATAYNLYGNFLSDHNLTLAIDFIKLSIEIREDIYKSNKFHYSLAECYHDYSLVLLKVNDFENARIFVDKAIVIREVLFKSSGKTIHPRLQDSINLKKQIMTKEDCS